MRVIDLIRTAADISGIRVQFLNECTLNAQRVSRKKTTPAHTRVTFATENMTPDDLLWLTLDRAEAQESPNRKPQFVGVVLWVPTADYERLVDLPDLAAAASQGETP